MTEPEVTIINSWNDLTLVLPEMSEEQLRATINFELSSFNRKSMIIKMHQRYSQLQTQRIRKALLAGEATL